MCTAGVAAVVWAWLGRASWQQHTGKSFTATRQARVTHWHCGSVQSMCSSHHRAVHWHSQNTFVLAEVLGMSRAVWEPRPSPETWT